MSDSDWPTADQPEEPAPPAPRRTAQPRVARRGPLIPTLIIVGVIVLLAASLAGLWTDILWFDSVGFSGVFTTTVLTRIVLGVLGFVLVAGLVFASLLIAYRQRPFFVPVTPSNEGLEQYREAIEPVRRVALFGIPTVLGILGALAASGQWRTYLAWRNQVPFGSTDAQFGRDLSFFVFTVPWLQAMIGFLTMSLIAAFLAAAFTHYVYGGLQLPGRGQSTRAAIAHLAVLGAVLALVRAGAYWVDRYALATKQSKLMTGIGYTDEHAVLPTKLILTVACVIVAGLFLAAIFTQSWRLPIIGVGLLVVTSVLVGGIYPAIIQSVRVNPSEKSLEARYLQRNIDATRMAYGLDGVEPQVYRAKTEASSGQLRNDSATVPGIRLVDPIVVAPTFRQLQALKNFYTFPDALDVDRYQIDGKESDIVIGVRELALGGIPGGPGNWLNDHTVYTHGFGLVAAYGNRRGVDGQPVFAVRNIPPTETLGKFEPRIYFGEQSPDYSIVGGLPGKAPRELDYPDDASPQGQANTTYAGSGGVPIGSFLRQAAYAVKYREFNFLLSDAVGSGSKILDHRTPLERVQRVAPWLTLDGNPYPALVDGKVLWIVDGYTTTANYPYSALESLSTATSDSTTANVRSVTAIRAGQVNYVRNSVKATVDAYDGTVHLYAWDEADPLLRTWSRAYPGTVEPLSAISGSLMSHLRYPEDLFKIQRLVLSRYHVTDALSFYSKQDYWRVPDDPAQSDQKVFQPPYYLTLAMPGQPKPSFSLTTTFMPTGDRQVLSGFLAVDADAGSVAGQKAPGFGTLRLLELPRDSNIKGPGQVQNDINSSNDNSPGFSLTLSQFLNNNRQQGSRVTLGNLLTLPVGGGLLYVQPIYVSANTTSAYPLSRVTVAAFGDKLAWSDTLTGALDGLFGGTSGASPGDSDPGSGPTPPPSGSGDDAALAAALADMKKAFEEGQSALAKGDFTAYGEAQDRLKAALDKAIAAAPKGGSVTIPSTPPPTATS
ncbi:MAG: UPF0182 family protein [Dermatophilaceae bacterium]